MICPNVSAEKKTILGQMPEGGSQSKRYSFFLE